MDDIAQDPSSSTPAERVARGRAIWDRYSCEHPLAALEDVITDLLHLADEDVPGGADAVLDRADPITTQNGPSAPPRRPAPDSFAARERALKGLPGDWERTARRVID
ncbi:MULTISPECIES: hypothetical protein [Streptomyces]|uniref:hypothetical protein n=1 Tax=Streptomyces TaxID=1883 RepID=UPI000E695276|nr:MULTISPECIES: hypothetical protein [Streptomyces]MDX3068272.1 hypothetical protein [Streptomyces sp. ND04-05B]MDX3519697.1 hypothetical protein [Streptomyces scabiei]